MWIGPRVDVSYIFCCKFFRIGLGIDAGLNLLWGTFASEGIGGGKSINYLDNFLSRLGMGLY